MKIGNHSVRTSSKYINKTINDVRYMFEADTYLDKSVAYSLIKKAESGKIKLDPSKRSVIALGNGKYRQEVL